MGMPWGCHRRRICPVPAPSYGGQFLPARAYCRVRAYTRLPTASPPHVFEGRLILCCTHPPPPSVPFGTSSAGLPESRARSSQPCRRHLGADEAHRLEHPHAPAAAPDRPIAHSQPLPLPPPL